MNARIPESAAPSGQEHEPLEEIYLGSHKTLAAIRANHRELTEIRRTLHANPEIGFEELFTSELVAKRLAAYGVDEIHRGVGKTGVVGVIRGKSNASGRSIGLRADMDALPMQEENEFGHRSASAGMMHACGHDGHVTMLLGAAKYLAQTRDFDGTVNLLFQPGEEGFAGARAMIDDGLFERFPCDQVYAMHNWPGLPAGKLAVRAGPVMAAAARLTIHIEGKGGHGAHPDLAIDPIVIAAHIITAAQTVVSRNVDPIDSAVLSLCAIQSGNLNAMSVIPREAALTGTVRSFKPAVQDLVETRLRALVESIATGFGAKATLSFRPGYPATVNTEAEALFGQQVATELVGDANVIGDLDPSMGAEDFSFMLQARPGAYFRIGQGAGSASCFLHNTRYDFNDEILPLGAALFVRLAERAMPVRA